MAEPIKSDGLSKQAVSDNFNANNSSQFANTLANLFSTRALTVLSATAAAALIGVSASSLGEYSGATYAPPASGCSTMQLQSNSDPEVNARFSGALVRNANFDESLKNFSTIYNTAGGSSTVSTNVQVLNPNNSVSGWIGPQQVDHNYAFNTTVSLKHDGPQGWSVSTSTGPNGSVTTFTDANGVATSLNGKRIVTTDGSSLDFTNPGNGSITQILNQGGASTTSFTTMSAYFPAHDGYPAASAPYLDVLQTADGPVIANGAAISLTLGKDETLLALPCATATRQSPNHNIVPAVGPPPAVEVGKGVASF